MTCSSSPALEGTIFEWVSQSPARSRHPLVSKLISRFSVYAAWAIWFDLTLGKAGYWMFIRVKL